MSPPRRVKPAICLALLITSAAAHAQQAPLPQPATGKPTPAAATPSGPVKGRIKSAAEEFDEGRRAFMDDDFETAAGHFENAFHDAPRPEPLRHAIRSRAKAGQTARAATLSQHALTRYPEDVQVADVAKQVLADAEPALHAITVRCNIPCSVAVDGRLSSLDEALITKLFVDPGDHALSITFSDDRAVPKRVLAVLPGTSQEMIIVAPPAPAKRPGDRIVVVEKPKPFNRVPFFIGAGLTVALGALTAVSYIDAKNSPGEEAVLRDCKGLGEGCATWKDAKAVELRTNVGLFATAGIGVATAVVGLFFTRWSGVQKPTRGFITPTVAADAHGASAGFGGTF